MKFFLSVPFSSKVDEKGILDKAYRKDLDSLIQSLEEAGHSVFCAPKNEKWHVSERNPVKALRGDMREIEACDIYVALVYNEISAGVMFGTGLAVANDKRIVIAAPTGEEVNWVSNALSGFENVSSLNFDFYDELANQILRLVSR
jgi:nucleoside 2-deoxyribosyltransferase